VIAPYFRLIERLIEPSMNLGWVALYRASLSGRLAFLIG
jgi:hypothetical protein